MSQFVGDFGFNTSNIMIGDHMLDVLFGDVDVEIVNDLGEFVQEIEPCQEMVIHYKSGSKFHVPHPRDIQVFRAKGGGHNLEYTVSIDNVEYFESGSITRIGEKTVRVDSGDVVGLACFHKVQDNGIREYVEYVIGGK